MLEHLGHPSDRSSFSKFKLFSVLTKSRSRACRPAFQEQSTSRDNRPRFSRQPPKSGRGCRLGPNNLVGMSGARLGVGGVTFGPINTGLTLEAPGRGGHATATRQSTTGRFIDNGPTPQPPATITRPLRRLLPTTRLTYRDPYIQMSGGHSRPTGQHPR